MPQNYKKDLSPPKKTLTQQQLELIRNTVAKGATPDELKLFLIVANRAGLDPFTRQIHFVKRGGRATVQTGIDGYRAIAERSGSLAGIEDALYDAEDQVHPNKATVTVYRMVSGQRVPFSASARWDEYVPQSGQDFMWRKMPYFMLGKVAEALALRKAFPNDLSGLYIHEEMQRDDNSTENDSEALINHNSTSQEKESSLDPTLTAAKDYSKKFWSRAEQQTPASEKQAPVYQKEALDEP
ncbi:MAG: phage recombination protein Bet [Candidatus Doudnabacteria bacterium]|nr:phage recombination protein Bet [Candidatus Doudnabacteria bacterium]